MSSDAAKVFKLYVDEKGIKPSVPNHLITFAKGKGIKIKYVDARRIIANPPLNVINIINDKKSVPNNASKTSYSHSPYNQTKPYIKSNKTTSNETNGRLTKIYEDYVIEKGENPSNTFDLVNYIQYHNINDLNYKDISQFLMNYKPNMSKQPKSSKPFYNDRTTKTKVPSTASQSLKHNYIAPPPVTTTMLNKYGINTAQNNNISPPQHAVYNNDTVRKLYQIYYKTKGTVPSTTQQLLQYGKSINIYVKWGDVNKFMKNDQNYLNSLVTGDALQNVGFLQTQKSNISTPSSVGKTKSRQQPQSVRHRANYGTHSTQNNKTLKSKQVSSTLSKNKPKTDVSPVYVNKNVSTLYQIYYKSKAVKASTPQQLLQYGKSVGIYGKWGEVNKFMKNDQNYLNSFVTDNALQNVTVPPTLNTNISTKPNINKPSCVPRSVPYKSVNKSNYGTTPSIKSSTPTKYGMSSIRNNFNNHRQKSKAMTDTALVYNNDNIRTLYQIYYKAKGMKASTAQQLLQYGKSVNIHAKWGEANKFMKNSQYYLNSLVTYNALQKITVPQIQKISTMSIKVEASATEYYWIKDLTLNSRVDDICNKLEPRLQESSTKINLYKDNEPLPRFQTLKQLGLKDGDSVSLGVHNTSIGMDSFLQISSAKKQYYQKFQSLSNLAEQSNQKMSSLFDEEDDEDDDEDDIDDVMDAYTDEILSNMPSGNVSNRDTLLHVMSGLAEANGQKCVFFNTEENIVPQDAVEHNSHLHIIEANNNNDKTFVLTLNSLKNAEEKDEDITEEEIFEMQQCIETNKETSHPVLNDIKSKLSQVHNVLESRIQIIGVFVGSFNVEYTISDLKASEIQKMKVEAGEMQDKMDKLFDDYQRLNIHPILFRQTYDISMFDEAGNRTFDEKETFQVGKNQHGQSETYTQPLGWTRYGLHVLGKYDNDKWLEPFQDENNWYRAYHGTASGGTGGDAVDAMSSIYNGGFNISYQDGRNGTTAVHGDGVYASPNPTFVENCYASTISIDTQTGLTNFKFMLMVAVKPDSVVKDSDNVWHVPHAKDVRPYGILIKKC